MNSYIESLPYKLEQLKDSPDTKVVLVLGNESCDLDSAVCALVLAHHQSCFSGIFALPILNIPKEDVILKVLTCLLRLPPIKCTMQSVSHFRQKSNIVLEKS